MVRRNSNLPEDFQPVSAGKAAPAKAARKRKAASGGTGGGRGGDAGGGQGGGRDGEGDAFEFDKALARLPRNDIGNSERFRKRFGDRFMMVRDVGWHYFDGKSWNFEQGETQAQIHAQKVAKKLRDEAVALEKAGPQGDESEDEFNDAVERAWKWASGCGNNARLKAMLDVAAPHLMRSNDDLNRAPRLFNTQNGTLYLGPKGEGVRLRAHDPLDLITHVSPAVYDAKALCPTFISFLDKVQPALEMQDFLQRWFGYCLSGFWSEQALLLFHGMGANGKSTLVELMRWLFGSYAVVLPPESLMQDDRRSGGQATPDLARLPGARLVPASEFRQGARLDEGLVKRLTGGESMPVRHLNKGFIDFDPEFKVILSSNHLPKIRGRDEGIWRRVLLVPFEQSIPRADRDPELLSKLKDEAEGILAWCVQGWEMYVRDGLSPPPQVSDATKSYREEQDPLGMFIQFVLEPAAGQQISSSYLYGLYKDWTRINALDAVSQTSFSNSLMDRGYRKHKSSSMNWVGVKANVAAVDEIRAQIRDMRADQLPVDGGDDAL